ncbi:MAG: single-stranded DNA-binding protein [Caldilineaceae bacterium]|jgi:single-strand DNA-binding protein
MFQQIIIVGNLGRDPEMRYTPSGVPVTDFPVAVSRRWTGQDGQQQEKTTWFRVTAWRRQAELASQYLSKGRQVMVVGEIEEPDVWQDRDGNHRASLQLTARTIQFLGGRGDMDSDAGYSGSQGGSSDDSSGPADEEIPF